MGSRVVLPWLYCLVGSWLVFGFFEYYFWHLDVIEAVVD